MAYRYSIPNRTNILTAVKPLSYLILAVSLLFPAAVAADYTGKVLGPDGKPVKDATVYLLGNPRRFMAAPTTRRPPGGA